jgi:hypothetical protein
MASNYKIYRLIASGQNIGHFISRQGAKNAKKVINTVIYLGVLCALA